MKNHKMIPGVLTVAALTMMPVPLLAATAAEAHHGWVSVLPPALAIGLALAFRQVIPALLAGVWIGAWAVHGFGPAGLVTGTLETFDTHILGALANADHASVILFTLLVGGLVGIISRNGGMQGIVERVVGFARNVRRASMTTVALGVAIFFDDYANTLVVGNTMRPITDRLSISREKLAYLVDSTAAPIACIALVTTWVGYEVGLIRDAVAGIEGLDANAYMIFLNSIAYSFYPLFALALVFAVVILGRDFGPMRAAEQRARSGGGVKPKASASPATGSHEDEIRAREDIPHRAINALLPIVVLVAGVIGGMFLTGSGETLRQIVGSADPYKSLIWGSMLGGLTAAALSLTQRVLSLSEVVESWYQGARGMLYAIFILVLAWALSGVTDALGTAHFLVELIGDRLHPGLMPTLVFVLAAATAFATGSSWGTMGILLPLMVPLSWALMVSHGMAGEDLTVLYATVAAVLGGAVWGDHCSPISDTTILSSMASRCDHIEHVRTQLPYALFAGLIAIAAGTLPAGFGIPWWICLPAGGVVVVIGLWLLGRGVSTADAS